MIKTIIIEDEFHAQKSLHKMLEFVCPEIQIVALAEDIETGSLEIEKHRPDLVFLDIRLKDKSAFDLLDKMDDLDFKIIFTTAYNQHAIKAFKFSTIDYLLKPIDPDELKKAVEKAKKEIKRKHEYETLLRQIETNRMKDKKIILKTAEIRHILDINDILYLKAEGAYTLFVTTNERIIISKNLKFYHQKLGEKFIRCHHSYLVNITHIQHLTNESKIILSNEESIPVSSRKKNEIIRLLK